MMRTAMASAALLVWAAWTSGATPPSDCSEIDAETARVVEARQVAVEQGQNAWRAVVPLVVLARQARAQSALEDADKQLARLNEARAERCQPDAPSRRLQLTSTHAR